MSEVNTAFLSPDHRGISFGNPRGYFVYFGLNWDDQRDISYKSTKDLLPLLARLPEQLMAFARTHLLVVDVNVVAHVHVTNVAAVSGSVRDPNLPVYPDPGMCSICADKQTHFGE